MRDYRLDEIQADLDMQLLTQMQIQQDLEDMPRGPRLCPDRPSVGKGPLQKVFNLVVFIIVACFLLYRLEMLIRGL